MKEYSQKLLEKAQDAIEAAEALVDLGKSEIGAGRAYYAMFYTAEALLNEKGMQFGKHSAVHAAFGEHLPRLKFLIQSSIAGFWIRLISGSKVIMGSRPILEKMLQ